MLPSRRGPRCDRVRSVRGKRRVIRRRAVMGSGQGERGEAVVGFCCFSCPARLFSSQSPRTLYVRPCMLLFECSIATLTHTDALSPPCLCPLLFECSIVTLTRFPRPAFAPVYPANACLLVAINAIDTHHTTPHHTIPHRSMSLPYLFAYLFAYLFTGRSSIRRCATA